MRLSNGIILSYGLDHLGPAILVEGNIKETVKTNSLNWTLQEGLSENMNCWRLPKDFSLKRTINQCSIEYLDICRSTLASVDTKINHPALTFGFENDAIWLYPLISEAANKQFISFIHYLKSEFNISERAELEKVKENFVDDIGPTILTIVNNKPSVLPEIPTVYRAPKEWVLIMWRINNYMVGPIINEDIQNTQKIRFDGLMLKTLEITNLNRGLYYFHMARFILFFEAWGGSPEALNLLEFIRLIKEGIDPLESIMNE